MNPRVLIVGGMAGGASCAARLRRLDERADIVIFDRSPWVSLSTCGLPYLLGGVIREESSLFAATPKTLCETFHIDVRTETEALAIDRAGRTLRLRHLSSGAEYQEHYDALVLAPGAAPVRPAWPGIHLPGVFFVRSLDDIRRLGAWIEDRRPQRGVVIGAGLVGLEMAENLAARGLAVSLIERLPHLAPLLDPEMTEPLCRTLESNGVDVNLGEPVAGIECAPDGGLAVSTWSGRKIPAGVVVIGAGVRPETGLAREAGLEIGELGGIRVDSTMRCGDPHIWAVGDAVEVPHIITGEMCLAPQAGPATRQARVAADAIRGRASTFRGAQGTVAFRCFGLTAAVTGATETELKRVGRGYQAVYLHPPGHSAFYPGSTPIHMKLLFAGDDGRLLGAQALGEYGAEKRIDVIALAIQKGGTVFDLEEAELCYAPQFGAARDPVNVAGMIGANVVRGDLPLAPWHGLAGTDALILDVRDRHEFAADHMDRAINIPLAELRRRMGELPGGRDIWVYCGIGQRAYVAVRMLIQCGLRARNLSGGYRTWCGWA